MTVTPIGVLKKMDFIEDREAVKSMILVEWTEDDHFLTGFRAFGDLDSFELFLVKADDVVLGCCAIRIHKNDSAQLAIYLRQDFRKKGFGRKMVLALHNLVKSLGANFVWSLVKDENLIMHKLLDDMGHDTFPAQEEGYVVRGLEI